MIKKVYLLYTAFTHDAMLGRVRFAGTVCQIFFAMGIPCPYYNGLAGTALYTSENCSIKFREMHTRPAKWILWHSVFTLCNTWFLGPSWAPAQCPSPKKHLATLAIFAGHPVVTHGQTMQCIDICSNNLQLCTKCLWWGLKVRCALCSHVVDQVVWLLFDEYDGASDQHPRLNCCWNSWQELCWLAVMLRMTVFKFVWDIYLLGGVASWALDWSEFRAQ